MDTIKPDGQCGAISQVSRNCPIYRCCFGVIIYINPSDLQTYSSLDEKL